jgi:hypothetical protein
MALAIDQAHRAVCAQIARRRECLFFLAVFIELDLALDRWRTVNGTLWRGRSRTTSAGERPTQQVPFGIVEGIDLLRLTRRLCSIGA